MIIPIRCVSCGKPLGNLWEKYEERIAKGETSGKVLDDLKITRYCCRATIMTHKDAMKKVARFRV